MNDASIKPACLADSCEKSAMVIKSLSDISLQVFRCGLSSLHDCPSRGYRRAQLAR